MGMELAETTGSTCPFYQGNLDFSSAFVLWSNSKEWLVMDFLTKLRGVSRIFVIVGFFWQAAGADLITETSWNNLHVPEQNYLLNSWSSWKFLLWFFFAYSGTSSSMRKSVFPLVWPYSISSNSIHTVFIAHDIWVSFPSPPPCTSIFFLASPPPLTTHL